MLLSIFVTACFMVPLSFAAVDVDSSGLPTNLDIQNVGRSNGKNRADNTADFKSSVESADGNFTYFSYDKTGELGTYNFFIRIARDIKNVVFGFAIIYLIISVLRILFSSGGDEDIKKWKLTIVWTTLGIMVMQSAFVVVDLLFDKNIDGNLALNFSDKILYPFVHLLEILASFAFLFMAFLAFYKIVTAGGDEEKAKGGKKTIIYAILGFLLMKIPGLLIKSIYGEAKCERVLLVNICKIEDPNISKTITIFTDIVNYINGFLALVIIVLVLYSGFLVLTSGGDDEKMKKAKNIVKYIVIGILLLVTSYILFNFFLASGKKPGP